MQSCLKRKNRNLVQDKESQTKTAMMLLDNSFMGTLCEKMYCLRSKLQEIRIQPKPHFVKKLQSHSSWDA